jgi:hypothetical protein
MSRLTRSLTLVAFMVAPALPPWSGLALILTC